MVKLVASSAFRYASKQLQAGEEFEATEGDAHVLRRTGKAADAQTDDAPVGAADEVGAVTRQRKPRAYKRRDMFAERPKDSE